MFHIHTEQWSRQLLRTAITSTTQPGSPQRQKCVVPWRPGVRNQPGSSPNSCSGSFSVSDLLGITPPWPLIAWLCPPVAVPPVAMSSHSCVSSHGCVSPSWLCIPLWLCVPTWLCLPMAVCPFLWLCPPPLWLCSPWGCVPLSMAVCPFPWLCSPCGCVTMWLCLVWHLPLCLFHLFSPRKGTRHVGVTAACSSAPSACALVKLADTPFPVRSHSQVPGSGLLHVF